jgi:hypothetical protein
MEGKQSVSEDVEPVSNIAFEVVGLPFIVSTGAVTEDSQVRKLIRSHVMMGKNKGKTRHRREKEKSACRSHTSSGSIEADVDVWTESPPRTLPMLGFTDPMGASVFADILASKYGQRSLARTRDIMLTKGGTSLLKDAQESTSN